MKIIASILISCVFCPVVSAQEPTKNQKIWTDSELATVEHKQFKFIGEYAHVSKKTFSQINLLKSSEYLVTSYQAGFPGRGWDQSAVDSRVMNQEQLDQFLQGSEKIHFQSPTLGLKAPEGATTMADGFTNVKDGILWAGGQTKEKFGSFKMHVEFRLPFKPWKNISSQDKGNSGIYIFNNYEIQILDTFALDYKAKTFPFQTESDSKQWCGCFYKLIPADFNATLPPLVWQTYEIDFTAPIIENGKKTKNARVTVVHNGVKIHDDVELLTGTGKGALNEQLARGHIFMQDHQNPTAFKNIWIIETKPTH